MYVAICRKSHSFSRIQLGIYIFMYSYVIINLLNIILDLKQLNHRPIYIYFAVLYNTGRRSHSIIII